ncbi:hypothetical protein LTS18_000461, partial [Coniosporium uncinatum]
NSNTVDRSTDEKEILKQRKASYMLFPPPTPNLPNLLQLPATVYVPPSKKEELTKRAPSAMRNSPDLIINTSPTSNQTGTLTTLINSSVTDVSEASLAFQPPNPFFAQKHRGHHRGSSSATVQIGLRLSMESAQPLTTRTSHQHRPLESMITELRREDSESGRGDRSPLQEPAPTLPATSSITQTRTATNNERIKQMLRDQELALQTSSPVLRRTQSSSTVDRYPFSPDKRLPPTPSSNRTSRATNGIGVAYGSPRSMEKSPAGFF